VKLAPRLGAKFHGECESGTRFTRFLILSQLTS